MNPGSHLPFRVPSPAGPLPRRDGEPSFSVVIPTYQSAGTLREAITSALAQTRAPKEVIVCDDSSSDATPEVLAEFSERIVVLVQPHSGAAAARNLGVDAATADYVDFLDADDVMDPTRHAALASLALDRPDLGALTTDVAFEVDGRIAGSFYRSNEFPVSDQRATILERNFLTLQSAVRRDLFSAIGGFDESLPVAQDWDLWIRLVLGGAQIGLVDEVLGRYRIHHSSMSASRSRAWRARAGVLEKTAGDRRLTAQERRTALGRVNDLLSMALTTEAVEALLADAPDARRRSWAVVCSRRAPVRKRIKAALATVLPELASRRLRERGAATSRGVTRQIF
jgi:GT2 family glycosyltransferase